MFDKTKGEIFGDLGYRYRVVSNDKWRETKLFDQAAQHAAEAFVRAGALVPIGFDDAEVLTQEYPATNTLLMLFGKKIRGRDHYYPYIWTLSPDMVKEMTALGKWEPITEN